MRNELFATQNHDSSDERHPPYRSALNRYKADVAKYGLLKRHEETELSVQAREGDRHAAEQVIMCNTRFVMKIAYEYRNFGMPFEDLVEAGNVGLVEALQYFDPTRGTKFITYAIFLIRKSIRYALNHTSHVVRIPIYRIRQHNRIATEERRLSHKLGRLPESDEIAKSSSIPLTTVHHWRPKPLERQLVSLSEPSYRHDTKENETIADIIADSNQPDPEKAFLEAEDKAEIRRALKNLYPDEQIIINMRFGFWGTVHTLQQVGDQLGVSRECIRQREAIILQKLLVDYEGVRCVRAKRLIPKKRSRRCNHRPAA